MGSLFWFLWPYFDTDQTPDGAAIPPNTREIFSDVQGPSTAPESAFPEVLTISVKTNWNVGAYANNDTNVPTTTPVIACVSSPARALITQISVWSGPYINGVQVSYGGQAATVQGYDTPQPPGTRTDVPVGTQPITSVRGSSGSLYWTTDVVSWLQFVSAAGCSPLIGTYAQMLQPPMGRGNPNPIPASTPPFLWKFDNNVLSSVTIPGSNSQSLCADAVIFGFRQANSYSSS
jgi:hypothetical protein